MGIRNLFGIFKSGGPAVESRSYDDLLAILRHSGSLARSGVQVTPLAVLGVPTVWACVRRISSTISTLPVHLMRDTGGASEKVPANPLYTLLHDEPNEDMSSVDFLDALYSQAVLRNNAYAVINFDRLGRAGEVVPVDDVRKVHTDRTKDKKLFYIVDGKEFEPREIIHIRANAANGINGGDMVSTVRNAIGLAIALQDNASDFFANGQRPNMVFTHPGQLSDKAYARIKASINKKWGDPDKPANMRAYETLLLEEAMKVEPVRATNKDSQMNEERAAQNKEIARLFGVPPHKVGILDNATFSNIEHQNIEYAQDTVLPWVIRGEKEFDRKLLTPQQRVQGFHFKFNMDALLRGSLKERYESYAIGITNGFLNKDEPRAKEGLPPIPDGKGKIFIEPMNMKPVGEKQDNATT